MRILDFLLTSALVGGGAVFAVPTKVDVAPRAAASNFWPFQSFKTAPFHPPVFDITTSGAELAPGYIFFSQGTFNGSAPFSDGTKETAPMIMTDTGDLVWSAANGTFANNFKVQQLHGEPVLTYWEGEELASAYIGHYYGAVHILNASYHPMYKVCPKLHLTVPTSVTRECLLDGHESLLTDKGTLIFTVYNITTADLTSVGGANNGYVWDCLFYEVDIVTSKILFSWSALEHVPINTTQNPIGKAGNSSNNPFDYFHINSVDPIGDSYLVNARHTWATYLVKSTGEVDWVIQGNTGGDFAALPEGGNFRWQHDARAYNITADSMNIRWFNNYNAFQGNGTAPSNGLELTLNLTSMTTTFVEAPSDPAQEIYSDAQGNNQLLPNGNTLLYYGVNPTGKEFGPGGDTRWTGTFGYADRIQSYRMFKQEWHATPSTLPSVIVAAKGVGYVSWNGATEVTSYIVYAGASARKLKKAETVVKEGFETSFQVDSAAKFVQVAAYSGNTFLRNSTVVEVK